MRRKELVCLVWAIVVLQICDLTLGDAEPAIPSNSAEVQNLRSSRLPPDQRPRLSSSQQQQILSDVQQHQRRYNAPHQDSPPSQLVSFPGLSRQISPKSSDIVEQSGFPSLAKYRVDRTRQQQQTRQKTDARSFLQTAQTQRYQPQLRQQQFPSAPSGGQQFGAYQNVFEDQRKLQLDDYYEKQRQLEQLKKQREQLILEQAEIKRQQDLLRLQQIAQLTSTARPTPTAAPSTTRSVSYATSTSSPLLLPSPTARRITPAESDLFLKAIATHQKKFTTTTSRPTPSPTSKSPVKRVQEREEVFGDGQDIPKDLLSLIQAQQPQLLSATGKNKPQIKIIYQTEKPSVQTTAKSSQYSSSSSTSSTSGSERDLLLRQLKLALAQSGEDQERNITTRDLILPNGKKLQVIRAPNGLSSIVPNDGASQFQTVTQALESSPTTTMTTTTTTTIRPAKSILEELTKGVLPPGADFELLRHKDDGKLEDVGKSPIQSQPGKKVTFVVLEEQPDGSYKVQGVKGNGGKENGADVDSIVEKIKTGELKLPPRNPAPLNSAASSNLNVVSSTVSTTPTTVQTTEDSRATSPSTFRPTTIKYTSIPLSTTKFRDSSLPGEFFPYVTVSPNSVSQPDNYVTSASTTSSHVYNSLLNFPSSTTKNPSSRYEDQSSRYTTAGTPSSRYEDQSSRYTTADTPSSRYEDQSSRYTTSSAPSSRFEDQSSRYTTSSAPSSRFEDQSSRYTTSSAPSSRFEDQSSRYTTSSAPSSRFEDQSSRFTSGMPSSRYEDASSRYTTSIAPSASPIYSMSPLVDVFSTTNAPSFSTTSFPTQSSSSYVHFTSSSPAGTTRTSASTFGGSAAAASGTTYSGTSGAASENFVIDDFNARSTVPTLLESTPNAVATHDGMASLLRREGLFAMAKYLRQSGLDNVLNETGPYTIFVPTDKAFRTLLVQLGGPEKAEQKFRENPRLLSGLLLHHVIPGAFRMESLQDEMTGVSLAGTQLRVNVYDMHDHEWNDVKVTTINGAKVAPNKRDIEIPQGIAHAVDRVMFPLPVGDLMQTLQADRERRFGTFLKILHASGLEDTLAGTKTFTVFAPIDAAFTNAATQNGRPVWTEADGPEAAKDIISRHVIPTTLYTGGMRYYHQRETLRPQTTLNIHKNGGRVRVNEAQVVTHNVPATNGVIHAIDGVL